MAFDSDGRRLHAREWFIDHAGYMPKGIMESDGCSYTKSLLALSRDLLEEWLSVTDVNIISGLIYVS